MVKPNLLYDPNYRQFDVEGYRVYRGRVDDPTALSLLAQYDYAGTSMKDYLGAVNPIPTCAPELGRSTVAQGCPVNFSTPTPGNAYTTSTNYNIGLDPTGSPLPFVQVKLGDRQLLLNGEATVVAADTAVTGVASEQKPELNDGGVPFVYVDKTAKNNLRYFYAVTAFDVNSIQSGPSSLESPRVTKSATPVAPGSNFDNIGNLSIGIFGRGVNMSAKILKAPSINSSTGVFTGPARPATGASIGFVGDFVKQVVTQSGEMSLTLDSMLIGSSYESLNNGAVPNIPNKYFYSIIHAGVTSKVTIAVTLDQTTATANASNSIDGGSIDGE
ncbi:MAG: hypothetical protein JF590_09100, partial [Gemmatimonadetes bacterium]|nr:hypothetical protein [Gemmatimonadota bacterium]